MEGGCDIGIEGEGGYYGIIWNHLCEYLEDCKAFIARQDWELSGSLRNHPVSLSIPMMGVGFSLFLFSFVHLYLLFRTEAILLST